MIKAPAAYFSPMRREPVFLIKILKKDLFYATIDMKKNVRWIKMCDRTLLNNLLYQVTDYSKEVFGDKLKKVILYGSYARGDYDDESDIDVMIMADIPMEDVLKYSGKICDFVSDINVDNSVFISPMIQSEAVFNKYKNVTPFYQNVAREGVRLYG